MLFSQNRWQRLRNMLWIVINLKGNLMFAVILRARPDPLALTATMGPLIRGVVMGLVGSAFLVADAQDKALEDIADASGARLLVAGTWPEGFARAIASHKGGGLIVMDTGLMLGQDFWPVLTDMAAILGDRPAITKLPAANKIADVFRATPFSLRAMRGVPHPDQAIVMPGSIARDIARIKADPFTYPYGKSLMILPSSSLRIG
jgi:hypothetical protein